ncbi:MAG: hypothetical protein KF724_11870 [Phycisphaeraceae bacterium]|nr:hypothetical protein [Phycisphaeraceae bacterium]
MLFASLGSLLAVMAISALSGCTHTPISKFQGHLEPGPGAATDLGQHRHWTDNSEDGTLIIGLDASFRSGEPSVATLQSLLLIARPPASCVDAPITTESGELEAWLFTDLTYAEYVYPQNAQTMWQRFAALEPEAKANDPKATPLQGHMRIHALNEKQGRYHLSVALHGMTSDLRPIHIEGDFTRSFTTKAHPELVLLLPFVPAMLATGQFP